MKVVLSYGYILLLAGLLGTAVHAQAAKIYSSVKCSAKSFHVASDDAGVDGKFGKALTVRGPAGVITVVRATNPERIEYLLDECREAVRNGRVAVNTRTGEVLPVSGFRAPDIEMPTVSLPSVKLSLHPVPRRAKSPNDL